MKAKPYLLLLLVASLALVLPSKGAFVSVTPGNTGGLADDNVLFNDDSLSHSGSLVQGNFNGSGNGFIVDFTSSSGNKMLMGRGGQATLTGLPRDDPFTNLTFALENEATFQTAILNPDATADGHILFNVNYILAGSPLMQTFTLTLDGNGQNFFTIQAGMGAMITSVTFSTSDTSFANANQFRIGGFSAVPINPLGVVAGPVPESGSTLMLLGASLVGIGLVRRRLAKRATAA